MNIRAGIDEYEYKYKYVSYADRINRKKPNTDFNNLLIFSLNWFVCIVGELSMGGSVAVFR